MKEIVPLCSFSSICHEVNAVVEERSSVRVEWLSSPSRTVWPSPQQLHLLTLPERQIPYSDLSTIGQLITVSTSLRARKESPTTAAGPVQGHLRQWITLKASLQIKSAVVEPIEKELSEILTICTYISVVSRCFVWITVGRNIGSSRGNDFLNLMWL